MKSVEMFALLFLCLIGYTICTDPIEENNVVVLKEDTFDEFIQKNPIVLVEFYAPWCGHCKQLAPEYEKAALELKSNSPPVPLAKVDATVENKLASRFDVKGYPTLTLFKQGEPFEYDGERNTAGIVNFVKTRADPSWQPPPPAVVKLTKENFAEYIKANNYLMVEFYAPWCGHCKRLAPDYEKAAQELKLSIPPIPLVAIDATVEADLAKQYNVEGYPTLLVFRNGKPSPYSGPRDKNGIVEYMTRNLKDAAVEVNTAQELKKLQPVHKHLILGLFEGKDAPLFHVFNTAANDLRDDYKSAFSFNPALHRPYKTSGNAVILLIPERYLSPYEPSFHVFDKTDANSEDFKKFVEANQFPLVGHYQPPMVEAYDKVTDRGRCFVFYTVDFGVEHRKATQDWRLKIAAIAKDYRDILWAVADDEADADKMKMFKLDDSGEDINIGCFDKSGKKYRMSPMDEFRPVHIRKFLDDMLAGKLTPVVRSQPVPRRQEGPVTIVVGETFNQLVHNNPHKDVLIEFYAPWCGHCKNLEPKYSNLAKDLAASQPNLLVAKIDATANDYPSTPFEVQGYPTIYYVAKGNRRPPVKYDGPLELAALRTFVEENAAGSAKDEL